MEMMKCPFCGEETFSSIKPVFGTSYALTCVDERTNPPGFMAGTPVVALGCSSCKAVHLMCPSLEPHN